MSFLRLSGSGKKAASPQTVRANAVSESRPELRDSRTGENISNPVRSASNSPQRQMRSKKQSQSPHTPPMPRGGNITKSINLRDVSSEAYTWSAFVAMIADKYYQGEKYADVAALLINKLELTSEDIRSGSFCEEDFVDML